MYKSLILVKKKLRNRYLFDIMYLFLDVRYILINEFILLLWAIRMSNAFSWEENNRRYAEAMAALEAKGDGTCYCPFNDYRGL